MGSEKNSEMIVSKKLHSKTAATAPVSLTHYHDIQDISFIEAGTTLYRVLNTIEFGQLNTSGGDFMIFNQNIPENVETARQWINEKVEYKPMVNLSSWTPFYSLALNQAGKKKEFVSTSTFTVVSCIVPANRDFIFMDVSKFCFNLSKAGSGAKRLAEVHLSGRGILEVKVVCDEGRQVAPFTFFITEWDGELKSGMCVGLSGIAPMDKKEVTTNLELIGIKITNKEFDMLVSANSHRTAKIQTAEAKKLPIVSLGMMRDAIKERVALAKESWTKPITSYSVSLANPSQAMSSSRSKHGMDDGDGFGFVGETTKKVKIYNPSGETSPVTASNTSLDAIEDPVEYAKEGWTVFRKNRKGILFVAVAVNEVWKLQCGNCGWGKQMCYLFKFRIKSVNCEEKEVEVFGKCDSGSNKKAQKQEKEAKARIAAIDSLLQSPMSSAQSAELKKERDGLVEANHNLKALALDVEYTKVVGKLSDLKAKAVLTYEDMANIKELERRRDYCYEHGKHTKRAAEDRQKVKDGLEPSYQQRNNIQNPLINGTKRGHAYQKKHRLNKKARVPETIPIVEKLLENVKKFADDLKHLKPVFRKGKIMAWDTEYDQHGARYELKHIREWTFKKLDTQEVLSIRRYSGEDHFNPQANRTKNPDYSDERAKNDILAFIPGYTLIAKERQNVDRNRLKSLIGELEYGRVLPQLMDLERDFISPITTTNINDTSKIYLISLAADTLYPCLFMEDDELKAHFDFLQDTTGYAKQDTCVEDVLELENIILLWNCILFPE